MSEREPITAAIRKSVVAGWDPWPAARAGLLAKCDAIDAVHAGLERENAELRQRVAELDESADSMHETDAWKLGYDEGFASADDWLGQHEDAMAEHGGVKLPVDADGEVWRIGDELLDDGMVCEVVGIGPNRLYYYVDATDTVEWTQADSRRHYHEPTVEDVLTKFGIDWEYEDNCEDRAALLAEYAAKLRLAEVVDE